MPRRIYHYDQLKYHTMPRHQRRLRKAFYFIERLSQINPNFREKILELRRLQAIGKISPREADQKASQLIMQTIES